ncbi:hypothetical protein SALBM311S_12393 [Streptomyces alboniger]
MAKTRTWVSWRGVDSTPRRSPLSGIEAHPASRTTPQAAYATARPAPRRAPPLRSTPYANVSPCSYGSGDALPDETAADPADAPPEEPVDSSSGPPSGPLPTLPRGPAPSSSPVGISSGRPPLDAGRGTTRAPLPGNAVGSAVGAGDIGRGAIGPPDGPLPSVGCAGTVAVFSLPPRGSPASSSPRLRRESLGSSGIGEPRSGSSAVRGSVNLNCEPPPGSPHACSQPPCNRASSRAMDSPRPVPPVVRARAGSARQKRLKTRVASPGLSPTP